MSGATTGYGSNQRDKDVRTKRAVGLSEVGLARSYCIEILYYKQAVTSRQNLSNTMWWWWWWNGNLPRATRCGKSTARKMAARTQQVAAPAGSTSSWLPDAIVGTPTDTPEK
ncbi:hypothetical protein NPIL_61271 [Nephila pilipes]|uniref:Uncharacterized protein n=1 Tax=Nephila pilipes TaxID=299642 RepID=A0A8X6NM24_NEPPI|nr:hypothetical protein NPIL_61271 [Nephila pilipes]